MCLCVCYCTRVQRSVNCTYVFIFHVFVHLSTPFAFHHPGSPICCRGYRAALASAHQAQPLPQTLSVLESTPQVRGMHTIIR